MSEVQAKSIEERVKAILAAQFAREPSEIASEKLLTIEYGMDDLDLLEITMNIEDEFGFEIDDEIMFGFTTPQQIIDHVTAKV